MSDAALSASGEPEERPTLLYHQTLIPTQNITHAVEGSFTLPNAHDLLLVRHRSLELWTLHAESGTLECIHTAPLFARVYAMVAVPTTRAVLTSTGASAALRGNAAGSVMDGAAHGLRRDGVDYVAVTSETGYVTLLRYELQEAPMPTRIPLPSATAAASPATNDAAAAAPAPAPASDGTRRSATMLVMTSLRGRFVKVSEMCLGRSGARLTGSGARMAVDGAGEALFIAALMRHKVLVPLHRPRGADDAGANRPASRATVNGRLVGRDRQSGHEEMNNEEAEQWGEEGEEEGEEGEDRRGSGEVVGDFAARSRAARRRAAAAAGVLTLGSPLEVERQTVTYSICALEGLLETTAFAALEEDICEATEPSPTGAAATASNTSSITTTTSGGGGNEAAFLKLPATGAAASTPRRRYLVVYAYNASLRQVQRTHLVQLAPTAHRLVTIPGPPCGPGGVLVCSATELTWYDLSVEHQASALSVLGPSSGRPNASPSTAPAGVFKCTVALPRRVDFAQLPYDPFVIEHAVTCVGQDFFMLLQDEQGDVFRVLLSRTDVQRAYDALRVQQQQQQQMPLNAPAAVTNPLAVRYFDTLPPASCMVLFRKGFLFVAAEAGPVHGLLKITRNGYLKESEYIVSHVKRGRLPPSSSTNTNTTASSSSSSSASKAEPVKSEPGGEDAAMGALAVPSATIKRERSEADDTAGQATAPSMAMPAPPSRLRAARLQAGLAAAAAASAAATATDTTTTRPRAGPAAMRVIALYQPHRSLRHMVFMQSYPNTPAITAFVAHIPGQDAASASASRGNEELAAGVAASETSASQQQQQQQQVQINAVAGRGADSTLLLARYGIATRREARYTLPAVFTSVLPITSAPALRRLLQEQRAAIRAATAAANARSPQDRLRALRQLAARASDAASGAGTWTDKLLLCTAQGTTVYAVGARVELDTLSGFVTTERTLAACTLRYGSGYVQVTPTALHVLAAVDTTTTTSNTTSNTTSVLNNNPSSSSSTQDGNNGSRSIRNGGGEDDPTQVGPSDATSPSSATAAGLTVAPTTWSHPHGRSILAAAVTPTLVLVSFAQGGGLASFDFGLAGTALQQCDVLPTFPAAPALALLAPPASTLSSAVQGELSALLFDNSALIGAASEAAQDRLELAAVATLGQEVFLLNPRRLREPLATISRVRGDGASAATTGITSVLLTYLGSSLGRGASGGGGNDSNGHGDGGGGNDSSYARRRLFCFIGHLDGLLARYELDVGTAQVMDAVEMSVGGGPVQLIAGDGERMCYVMCGGQTWRCAVYDGVAKVVPWRFALRQTAFARFVTMPTTTSTNANAADQNAAEGEEAEEEEEGAVLTLRSQGRRGGELVVAVRERELGLFSALQGGAAAAAAALEYSLSSHALPVAGRRLLRHPTRPSYHIVLGSVHRGQTLTQRTAPSAGASGHAPLAARTLGKPDQYTSTLQLFHEASNKLSPPYYFADGDAVLAMAVGSFAADFGREPVLVVAAAAQYTHGAGCHRAASCAQGWLRTFRFITNTTERGPGGGPTGAALFNADGSPVVRLAPLHNTLIRNDGEDGAADFASALHICEEVGLLFVGLGPRNGLRIYGWGQQHFLRKRHLLHVCSRIVAIETVFVGAPAASGSRNARPPYYCPDLYRCPLHDPDAVRRARERQLLVVCATLSASVFVASLRPGGQDSPSYLLQVAQDHLPRAVTCMAVVDERTIALADRAGNVTFLRIPASTRFGFAEPVAQLADAELSAAQRFMKEEQALDELASYAVGAVVTDMHVQAYDPSHGEDATLATRMVLYGTSAGSVGAFVPFVAEEDAVLARHVQGLLAAKMSPVLLPQAGGVPYELQASCPTAVATASVMAHNVIDGDLLQLYQQAVPELLSVAAKTDVEEELERVRRMVQARRRVLGLPPLSLSSVRDLTAKQRALITLPQ